MNQVEVWVADPGTALPASSDAEPPAGFRLVDRAADVRVFVDPARPQIGSAVRIDWMDDSVGALAVGSMKFVAVLVRGRDSDDAPWLNAFALNGVRFDIQAQMLDVGVRTLGWASWHPDSGETGKVYGDVVSGRSSR